MTIVKLHPCGMFGRVLAKAIALMVGQLARSASRACVLIVSQHLTGRLPLRQLLKEPADLAGLKLRELGSRTDFSVVILGLAGKARGDSGNDLVKIGSEAQQE